MSTVQGLRTSIQDYLAFDRQSEAKHELWNGEIREMTGASRAHNLIVTAILAAFVNQLQGQPCEIYPSDMRLRVSATGFHAYPDVSIVCDTPDFADDHFDTLLNPLVLVEVLSPSTEAYDRGRKFRAYRQLPSLQDYLLVAQNTPLIERFSRQPDDSWHLTEASGMGASMIVPSVACTLELATVYARVHFPPPEAT